MRTWPTGAMRAVGEWSVTRAAAETGAITASLSMEPGFDGPSAASIAWRAGRRRLRWMGHAEISARRGRVLHLALERGAASRVRVELHVQDREFDRPRVGFEIAVRRTFAGGGVPSAAAPLPGGRD
jgi:hypothetical protein